MRIQTFACAPLFAAVALAELSVSDAPSMDSKYWSEFVEYAIEYGKTYLRQNKNDELVQKRFQAFQINMDRIQEHNAKYEQGVYTFTLGLNDIADLTDDEYKKLLGYKSRAPDSSSEYGASCRSADEYGDLPYEWDWRTHDVVTPVKNQGQCGSCWAFSAVASMESVYAITTGHLVSFSEQELVDCTKNGADTCTHGGEMQEGFEEIIEHHGGKIDPENVYEYTATSKGVCHAMDNNAVGNFTGFNNVTSGCELDLQTAVAKEAVVAVAIDASSFSFQLYKHGVYNQPTCGYKPNQLDHGVAVVGYGVYRSRDTWLVKNSWGTSWGMHGYIMMSRNEKNQCGIATDASYPVMQCKNCQRKKFKKELVYIG